MALQNTIQVRRGTDAQRLAAFTPAEGELIYTTDEQKLWIGDGATVGGIAIGAWTTFANGIYFDDAGESVVIGATTQSADAAELEVTGNVRVDGQAWSVQQTATADSLGDVTLDFDEGNSWVLEGNDEAAVTAAFSNGKSGASYLVKVLQGSVTASTVTWPGSVVWLGNEPMLTTTLDGFNVITFYYDKHICRFWE